IGHLGLLMYLGGKRMTIEETKPIPNYRSDMVDVIWIDEKKHNKKKRKRKIPEHMIGKGAEAEIKKASYLGWQCVVKDRVPKRYRLPELDNAIRLRRTLREGRFLSLIKDYGILTPYVFDIDKKNKVLTISYIPGNLAKYEIDRGNIECCHNIGNIIGKLHERDIVHNDLTTSNFIVENKIIEGDKNANNTPEESKKNMVSDNHIKESLENNKGIEKDRKVKEGVFKGNKVYIIDFGLGKFSNALEDKAVDLIVLKKSILSTHYKDFERVWTNILEGYKIYKEWKTVVDYMDQVEKRGRYF
ncbi:MAG TPA: Kae1-associated serine/threonine protein kinase, partial [Methanothermococcus okinawensis]|nr:Kae1-associated serine/threonine protein kinase [Methanothermococcus okinawensis]